MALLPSNFSANSLTGTVVVSNGVANINLGAINFTALEGTKTFSVKLRKYSNSGTLLGVSNAIVIPDRTRILSLVADVSNVSEISANVVSYTITTANIFGSVTLNWSTTGTTTGPDFVANTGTVLVSNNVGTFSTQIAADLSIDSEAGEYYGIQLSPTYGAQVGNVIYATTLANAVTISDTSKQLIVNSVESNALISLESSIIRFDITTINAGNTTLYYSTVGSLTNSELISANTGSFTPTSDANTTSITLRVGSIQAEPRNVKLQIREQSPSGNIKFTGSNVFFYTPVLVATGGSINTYTNPAGVSFKSHAFTSGSGTFTVSSTTAIGKTISYLVVGGGGSGGFLSTGYDDQKGGGAGGILQGNLTVYTGNTFTATIGGGGTGGTKGSAYENTLGTRGSNTTLTSPTYNRIASLGGGIGYTTLGQPGGAGDQTDGSSGGSPTSYNLRAFQSLALGAAGTQGWPGNINPAGAGGGGGGGGAGGGLYGRGDGGVGLGISNIHPSRGTPGPNPSLRYFAGGGGGYCDNNVPSNDWDNITAGGYGGGGRSWVIAQPSGIPTSHNGQAGTINTGGGGGSASSPSTGVNTGANGGNGGSGIVIIRYPNELPSPTTYVP